MQSEQTDKKLEIHEKGALFANNVARAASCPGKFLSERSRYETNISSFALHLHFYFANNFSNCSFSDLKHV